MRSIVLAVMMLAGIAPAALADHRTLDCYNDAPPHDVAGAPDADGRRAAIDSRDLDVTLKFGIDGFRFGSRLFGDRGVAGLWLNGQRRADGFSIDGRLQNEAGRAFNFRLEAEAVDAATRAAWRWLFGL